jgi:hypothetical protein
MNECPEMLEHFNEHKYRSSHNSYDREKNVQQIRHRDVLRVVLHVKFLSFHFRPKPQLVRRTGVLFALRTLFPPADRNAFRLPETDDMSGLANPRRRSTAPETRHATAVNRNVGPYADPSHET